jgi:hypothetical protein
MVVESGTFEYGLGKTILGELSQGRARVVSGELKAGGSIPVPKMRVEIQQVEKSAEAKALLGSLTDLCTTDSISQDSILRKRFETNATRFFDQLSNADLMTSHLIIREFINGYSAEEISVMNEKFADLKGYLLGLSAHMLIGVDRERARLRA